MNSIPLQRTYYFSDTFGGGSDDPLVAPDADALISTDFRSRPTEKVHREFDIYGRERVADHILRLICRLHDEIENCLVNKQKKEAGATGILINHAPRTQTFQQGEPFHLVELIGGKIRIVAPLDALRPVKKRIERFQRLPNDNGLFGPNEQFRSSFVGRLLENDHGIPLKDADPSEIRPDHAGWVVEYVDRFGNIVTQDNRKNPPRSAFDLVPTFRLRIGDIVQDVVASDLNAAPPGKIAVYRNDGCIEVVRKWKPRERSGDAVHRSAYIQFDKPWIGAPVCNISPDPKKTP